MGAMLKAEGRNSLNLDKFDGKEVSRMNDTTGLDTAVEPVSTEPDTGADVQQDGDFLTWRRDSSGRLLFSDN